MTRKYMYFVVLILSLSIFHCGENQKLYKIQPIEALPDEYSLKDSHDIFMGEIIYVPVYSSIYHIDDKRTMKLSATLSIHNTDLENRISILKINYHGLKGKLLKRYITEEPRELNPLETMNVVIEERDASGGTGANFIVEWISDKEVSTPVVETVMLTTAYSLGVSFLTSGKVIKRFGKIRVTGF